MTFLSAARAGHDLATESGSLGRDSPRHARKRARDGPHSARRIYGDELRRSKESFFRYAIKMVLKYSFGRSLARA